MTASSLDSSRDDVLTDPFVAPPRSASASGGASLVVSDTVPAAADLVRIAVSDGDGTVRLSAAGEIDSSSAPVVRAEIDAVLRRPLREVVLDLDEVTFLDSAGLSALASAHRSATERGVRLRVLASGRAVIRPLQITGLWDLLGAEQIAPGAGRTA